MHIESSGNDDDNDRNSICYGSNGDEGSVWQQSKQTRGDGVRHPSVSHIPFLYFFFSDNVTEKHLLPLFFTSSPSPALAVSCSQFLSQPCGQPRSNSCPPLFFSYTASASPAIRAPPHSPFPLLPPSSSTSSTFHGLDTLTINNEVNILGFGPITWPVARVSSSNNREEVDQLEEVESCFEDANKFGALWSGPMKIPVAGVSSSNDCEQVESRFKDPMVQ